MTASAQRSNTPTDRRRVSAYRELPSPPALSEHFLCLWTQFIGESDAAHAHRVLPDACVDIVFINHEAPIVVGPWTEPFTARFPPGTAVVGARFHPGRASGLLRLPASALLNQSVPLRLLWSATEHDPFQHVRNEGTVLGRLTALESALHTPLLAAAPLDPEVRAAIHWIAAHPHGRVEQLSRWLGISHRHLQRRFAASVGYGPKMFQSVLRFQRLLHLAGAKRERRNLAALAAEAGYADQAHMAREVSRYSGSSPAVSLPSAACTLNMSDLFKTPSAGAVYP